METAAYVLSKLKDKHNSLKKDHNHNSPLFEKKKTKQKTESIE